MNNCPRVKPVKRLLAPVLLMAVGILYSGISLAQQVFPTPESAAQAFVKALGEKNADHARLAQVLGDDWRAFVPLQGVQRRDVDAFLKQYRKRHNIEKISNDKALLSVGTEHWTLPIPMTKDASGWRFDIQAGSDEIRARRIGRNELDTLQSVLAYHDAQMEYASKDRNGDGSLEYAQKIFSSSGQHDGLYWPDDQSAEISPLGPLFGKTVSGEDWHGYHFRILDGQGPSAPGGAYSYLIGARMARGFALIAWPAQYNESGVKSFMISHEGQVFEKDLGPDGEQQAQSMQRFDPDDSWHPVP